MPLPYARLVTIMPMINKTKRYIHGTCILYGSGVQTYCLSDFYNVAAQIVMVPLSTVTV